MNEENGKGKGLDAAAIAAGLTAAAATGIGASVASGARQFGDTALRQARDHAEATLKRVAAEDLEQSLKDHVLRQGTREFLVDLYASEGRSVKHAERMAEREMAKRAEQLAKDATKHAARLTAVTEQNLRAGLNQLETKAAGWKAASILEKPSLGFQAASTSVKLGVLGTAAALGLGAGWAVHSLRKAEPATSFAERIQNQRATSMTKSR